MSIAVRDIRAGYDVRTVLFDVTAEIRNGECLGVFGHNGAGKTTLMRALSGSIPLTAGAISVATEDGMPGRPRIRLVPQEEIVFEHLTVAENLKIGLWDDRGSWRHASSRTAEVCAIFPAVGGLLERRAGTLSGGERRQVAIARALMSDPDILLVDEPCLGLSPVAVDLVIDKIAQIRETGRTVVLVEQNLPMALEVVTRYYVLRQGRIVAEGDQAKRTDAPLQELYELI
jgi:branched-chain amino acid transport system ATP-binding protein